MNPISRRSFLAATAAAVTAPAIAAPAPATNVDVAIVGAGAAGIAAARRVIAAGRKCVVLEAAPRIGGRCVTDTEIFGVPFDLGAHWIHMPDINPVAKLAPRTGLEIYPAPVGQRIRIGRRNAREGELEDYLSSFVRANRAIAEAARGKADVAAARALPHDLGAWKSTLEFVLGPYACGKDLAEVSAVDFARSVERDIDAFCRQGFGALVENLAQGLPVRLGTPVTRIEWGNRLELETPAGRIVPRHVIVTASTDVLLSGRIQFSPELPKRQTDALNALRLGSYDHIAVEIKGNPFGLQRDELVLEQSSGAETAGMLANVSGTSLAMIDVGGRFGRSLAAKGADAMKDFAIDWLDRLYGSDVTRAVGRVHATRWNEEPWVRGAFSAASPGGQGARRVLMEPLRDRIYFAGEAAHETLWGTVGGAWESGERAAEMVLRRLGALKEERPEPAARKGQGRKGQNNKGQTRSRRSRPD